MKKRIFALALAVCMMLSVMPSSFAGNGFLTLDGAEPAVQERQSQPQQDGILTLDNAQSEVEETPVEEEPVYGILTPDAPVEEPKAPVVHLPAEDTPVLPPEDVQNVVCDVCGYYDGYHAADCATQQPEEEETPAPAEEEEDASAPETIVSVPEEPVVTTYAVETVSAPETSRTLTITRNARAYNALMLLSDEGSDVEAYSDGLAISDTNGLEMSKTVTETDDGYEITLEAFVTGTQVTSTTTTAVPMDVILVLDTSKEMVGTTTTYEYVKYTGSYAMQDVYEYLNDNYSNRLYVLSNGVYHQVSVWRQGNSNRRYTLYYGNGWDSTILLNEVSGSTVYTGDLYIYQQSTSTDTARLAALQEAANAFIDTVATQEYADNVVPTRIAIVQYHDTSDVLSGSQEANEEALVPVTTAGATALKGIVQNLSIDSDAAANCNYGLADAKNIFQDVSAANANRKRIVILLSAGVFGASGSLNTGNDYIVAMDTIWLASILKMPQGYDAFRTDSEQGGTYTQSVTSGADPNRCERYIKELNGYKYGIDFNSRYYGSEAHTRTQFEALFGSSYSGCGATVYCVGLEMPASTNTYGALGNRINEAMYRVSSHRPDGTHVQSGFFYNSWETQDWSGHYWDSRTRNLHNTYETTGYFLNSDNANSLSSIFETISTDITTGGASNTTLTETTVVQDVVSDAFALPDGADAADIKVYVAKCNSVTTVDGNTTYTWDTAVCVWQNGADVADDAYDMAVNISDKTVQVTGFDFTENWVGDSSGTVHGYKLIVVIPVEVESDFLGGNDVASNNDAQAGVYDKDGNLIENFDNINASADVDVVAVKPLVQNVNVYLTDVADLEKLLQEEQDPRIDGTNNAYVTITYTVKIGDVVYGTYVVEKGDKTGTWYNVSEPVLYEDTTYTITCEVDAGGDNTAEKSEEATVNVFMPEVTFRDSTIYLSQLPVYESFKVEGEGDDAVTIQTGNYQSVVWMHGDDEAPASMGVAPVLVYDYDPAEAAFDTCTNVNVTVAVDQGENDEGEPVLEDITDYVNFTDNREDDYEFTVHVLKPSFEVSCDDLYANYATEITLATADWSGEPIVSWSDNTAGHEAQTTTETPTGWEVTPIYNVTAAGDEVISDGIYAVTEQDATFNVAVGGFTITKSTEGQADTVVTYGDATHIVSAGFTKDAQFVIHTNKFKTELSKSWEQKGTYGQDAIFTVTYNKPIISAGRVVKNDENEIQTTSESFQVVISVDNDNEKITISEMLCGIAYTFTEETDWTWRYQANVDSAGQEHKTVKDKTCAGHTVMTDVPEHQVVKVDFSNKLTITKWFDAIASKFNIFGKGEN